MNRSKMATTLAFGLAALLWTGHALHAQALPAGNAPEETLESDPKAIEVIDRYLQAIGGRENLLGIRDRNSRFVNRKFSPTGVTEMKMVRLLKRPKEEGAPVKIREEWELPGLGLTKEPLHFIQVYDGNKGYVKTMGYVSGLTGRTLTVFVWDKPIDDFFMTWKDDGYTVKYLGKDTLSGAEADRIQTISFAGKQRMQYWFDSSTGLLLKKEWSEAGVKGPVRKEVFFDEYLKIRFSDNRDKWLMFPVNQKIFESGELSLEKEYQKITINAGIEDSLFGRPDGPAFEDRPQNNPKKPAAGDPKKPTSKPASKPASQPASKPKG